ncbi:hypothetical protein AGMMS49574_11680 [Bacteroidia bacterium]|nr:hypothetical protein AGMMS49574_11680 [Bacteroidia bacterium]
METVLSKQTRHSNMSYDDFLKLKAVVLFVLEKCPSIDMIHLFKIIYFADKNHFATYGRRIVNDTFFAMQNGPVPSALYNAVKLAKGDKTISKDELLLLISNAIEVTTEVTKNKEKDKLKATEHPDMDELSSTDIRFLTQSISENKDLSFNKLSLKSHDAAWEEAWNKKGHRILGEFSMARAAGASEDTITFIKEQRSLDTLFAG